MTFDGCFAFVNALAVHIEEMPEYWNKCARI